jgi:PKD repeat protein
VSFDGSLSYDGDGTIVSHEWDFGDLSNDSSTSINHTYTAAGDYTAWLTVTDSDGASASEAVLITVSEPVPNNPPVAIAVVATIDGLSVAFDGSHSYDLDGNRIISSYDWDYGDGNTGTGIYPNHVYSSAGNFTATLTVTDDEGGTGTDTVAITVADPPPTLPSEADHLASGEIAGAGTVSGDYTMTWADGAGFQSITEKVSGGKRNKRYSYLAHTWQFSVTAGASVTVYANAWSGGSADGDSFRFEWSTSASNGFQTLFTVNSSTESTSTQSVVIDDTGTLSGPVYIRVVDTNDTAGNIALDTVHVDQLYIKTVAGDGDPPVMPSGITLDAVGYKVKGKQQVDLTWSGAGTSVDIYRDSEVITTGTDGAHTDNIGVKGGGSYTYKVCEFETTNCSDPLTVVF